MFLEHAEVASSASCPRARPGQRGAPGAGCGRRFELGQADALVVRLGCAVLHVRRLGRPVGRHAGQRALSARHAAPGLEAIKTAAVGAAGHGVAPVCLRHVSRPLAGRFVTEHVMADYLVVHESWCTVQPL